MIGFKSSECSFVDASRILDDIQMRLAVWVKRKFENVRLTIATPDEIIGN